VEIITTEPGIAMVMHGDIEVHAKRSHWARTIALHIISKPVEKGAGIWRHLTQDAYNASGLLYEFAEMPFTIPDPEPSFHLSIEGAQFLMDQLWQCGLRPSEGTGSAGAMAAVQEHLKDMRKLVFDKPGVM
jgi:hypothetical protein